jgi:hypothetical protein
MRTATNCLLALLLGFSVTFLGCDTDSSQDPPPPPDPTVCRSFGCVEDPACPNGQCGCTRYVCLDDSSPLPTVSPANLDFGTVTVGTTIQLTVTVAGLTDRPHPVVAGDGFALGDGQYNADYTSLVLNITFTPPTTGTYTGTLTVTQGVTVPLSGISQ